MQSIHQSTGWAPGNQCKLFIKRSFLFALLYSTLLFALVRIFFYDFPFTIREAFELYVKMLLVVWAFIVSCKLVLGAIDLVESNISKIKFTGLAYLPVLKKNMLILLTSILSFVGSTQHAAGHSMTDAANNCTKEPVADSELIS